MDYTITKNQNEKNDRRKSAIITLVATLVLFLIIYFYQFTKLIPKSREVVTTMLINFGDNRNGDGLEEPANQEGSKASVSEIKTPETKKQPETNNATEIKKTVEKKAEVEKKVITGTNTKAATKKVEKTTEKKSTSKSTASSKSTKSNSSSATTANAKTGQGDGKGNAAIGNLIKGRGSKTGSQGDGKDNGNSGDPLGGEGNGDSKIGVDRKLIAFIPGTMGRGGAQPNHNCTASGSISISYTVDKAGNVISAKRAGGVADACISSTSVDWVKKYVKAEKANVSSTGTYKITF